MTNPDLTVRPPKQERTRQAWERILDAGVELLEEGGYESFTIAGVCDRAGVSAPTIYARVTSKDALFFAVFERGIARLVAGEAHFEIPRWVDATTDGVIRGAVQGVIQGFLTYAAFLKPVILRSAVDPEVKRRGSRYVAVLGDKFAALILSRRDSLRVPDPDAAVHVCFRIVFSALVIDIAYGSEFATNRPISKEAMAGELEDVVLRRLLR